MATRQAHARREGTLKDGKDMVDFGGGRFKAPYSVASRFEGGSGTNPEELLGAIHASCFAVALPPVLSDAQRKPDYIEATAHVTIKPQDGGFRISSSHRMCEAGIPGIDAATFVQHDANAEANCPVPKALGGTQITLEATLRGQ